MLSDLPPPPLPSVSPEAGDQRFSPIALWAAIRKSWAILLASVITVTLAATFYTLGQTKLYEAQATVLFDSQAPRPLGNAVEGAVDMSGDYWNKKEQYKTQFWVIQSQRIAELTVKELALHKDARFLGNLAPDTHVNPRSVAVEDAARILRGRIAIEPVRDTRLTVVKYTDADPVRAQRILNVLVDVYTQNNLDDALEAMNTAADWFGHQVGSLRKDLESSEMALHGYKKDKNILSVSMDDQNNILRGEIQQLSGTLTGVLARREQIGARRAELQKINPEEPENVPATELLRSSLLQELRGTYIEAKTLRDALMVTGKGPNHPDVKSAASKVEAARGALLAEVKNVQAAIDHEFNVATKEMAGLSGLLETAKKRALELNLLEIEYNRLKRSKENSEKLYGVVTERSKENDLTRMLRINNIRVVDRPQRPKRPVSPNLPANIAVGLAAGLALGLMGAVGRALLDRSIKSPEDAERELGLAFLGLLPRLEERKEPGSPKGKRARRRAQPAPDDVSELVIHKHPSSGVAEAARAIRTNILFMSPDRPFRVLLVTSAAPSEGKTTVACCMAIAMAQAGKRVALVDCDMRRPRIHRVFGKPNDVGITTALIDPSTLGDAIRETEVPNLSMVGTGPIPPNPAELLHSDAFERLLADLRQRFDSVVIDSPPVAPVTDAAIISTRVDATILVVRAGKTRKDLARRAKRSLSDLGGRIAGTVLNAVDFDQRDYGYYQYYYYKRQGYAADPPKANAAEAESSSQA